MAFVITVTPSTRLGVITYTGDICATEAEEGRRMLFTHPDFHPTFRVLVDMRSARAQTSLPDNRDLAASRASSAPATPPQGPRPRTAFLASDPQTFGTLRQYAALASLRGLEADVFMSLDEAHRYLELPAQRDQAC